MGRRARLQPYTREGPEWAPKPPFQWLSLRAQTNDCVTFQMVVHDLCVDWPLARAIGERRQLVR